LTDAPLIGPPFTLLPYRWARPLVAAVARRQAQTVPSFTNVGFIDLRLLPLDGMTATNVRPFPPLEHPPKLLVCALTAGETLSFSCGHSRSHLPAETVERLFEAMEELIATADG
jgi:NRPS condensation-like uncharacterized protein